MDHAVLMDIGEAAGCLAGDFAGIGEGERSALATSSSAAIPAMYSITR